MAIRYLDEEVKESSIRYLDDEPSEPSIRYLEEDPSLGQIGTGLLAEIVLGEGGKYAGATAGAAVGAAFGGVGAVPGAAIGYLTGAIGGGNTGSIAAQRAEGRDDISWGRVTADTLLNVLPFGAGKVTKGAKFLPRVAKATLTRGTQQQWL